MTKSDERSDEVLKKRQAYIAKVERARRLKDKGMSNVAIGKEMGLNESSVRRLLAAEPAVTTVINNNGEKSMNKFLKAGALVGGVMVGVVLMKLYDDQKSLIIAVNHLTNAVEILNESHA